MYHPDRKKAMYHEVEKILTAGYSLSTRELYEIASKHNIPISIDAITKSIKTGALEHTLGRLVRATPYKKRIMISLEEISPDQVDFTVSRSVIDAACARPKAKSS